MAIALDASTPAATTIVKAATSQASASFSPPANSLIVVFIGLQAVDSASAQSVSAMSNTGTSLTWTRKVLANHSGTAPGGSAEIWSAFNTSLQTITITANFTRPAGASADVNGGMMAPKVFTGAATSLTTAASNTQISTAAALCTASVTTTANNSWVWGIALNWSNSTVGTAGTAQTIVESVNDTTSGDAEWTQKQNATTPTSGTVVTINDTAPSVIHLLAVIEILPAPSGTVFTQTLSVTGVGAASVVKRANKPITVTGVGTASVAKLGSKAFAVAGSGVPSLVKFDTRVPLSVAGSGVASVAKVAQKPQSVAGVGAVGLVKLYRHTYFLFGVGAASVTKLAVKPLAVVEVGAVSRVSQHVVVQVLSVAGVGVVSLTKQVQPAKMVTGIGVPSLAKLDLRAPLSVVGSASVSVAKVPARTLSVTGSGLVIVTKTGRKPLAVVGSGVVSGPTKLVIKGISVAGVGVGSLIKIRQHAFVVVGVGAVSITPVKVSGGPQPGLVEVFFEPVSSANVGLTGVATVEVLFGAAATAEVFFE